jgi:hypothetical protein
VSQRFDSGLCKRQLQTIYFAVAEYHAAELLFYQTFCATSDTSSHQRSLDAAMKVFKRISIDDDSKLGRVVWPMVMAGEATFDKGPRQWIQDALLRTQTLGFFECVNRAA